MRKLIGLFVLAAVLQGCAMKEQQPRDLASVAPYPAAQTGYVRHVVWLPQRSDEQLYRVELIAGKQMLTDCNTRGFSGQLNEHSLQGWGYTYYQVDNVNGPVSTMMACPQQEKIQDFVALNLTNSLLRYNSKLPVVVYLPEGFELRYRIWSAAKQVQEAQTQ